LLNVSRRARFSIWVNMNSFLLLVVTIDQIWH
jgi:hypothetical protein